MHSGRLRKILHILILNTFLNTVWCAINKDQIFHTDYPQKNHLLLQYFKQQFQNSDNSYKKIGIVKIRQQIGAFKTEATKNRDTYSELYCDVISYSHGIRLNFLDNRAIESTSTELSARAEAMEYPLAYCLIKINTGFYYYEKKNWPKYLFCLQQAFEKYNNCSYDEFPLKKYSLYQLALGHYQFEDFNKSLYFAKLCSRVNPDNIGTDMFNNHLMALNYAKLNQSDKANHLFKKNENDALKENRQEWFWISKAYIFMNSNNNVTDSLLSVYEKLKNYRIDNCLFELGTFIIHQNGNHVTEDIRVKNIISELNLMKRKISDPHLLLRYNESLRTYHRKYKNWPLMNQFADSVIEAYKNLSTIKNLNLKTQLETTDLINKNKLKTLSINDLKNKFWLMTTLISVGLFLVIVIIFTQVKKSQIMKERDQLLLASENLSLQNQLHEMQTKLNLFVQTKINKRNAIDELMRKFNLTKDENGNLNAQLIMELRNSTILTKYDWFKFREMFSAAYGNFLEEAETKLPDISQAELRYLALKKLQLKTPDMAKMMGISETSVRSIKSRLLKKYPEFNKIS
jgi:hypothetical protein